MCHYRYRKCIFLNLFGSGVQTIVPFHLERCPIHLELTAQWWKHSPTICHGLTQAVLEKGEALEHMQYIDDIVWGNTAEKILRNGKK